MPRSSQLQFPGPGFKSRVEYGGGKECGKRREVRPFDHRVPMHITMRSKRATGSWTLDLFRHKGPVERLVRKRAKQYRIRIHGYANAGNHLHLVIQAQAKDDLTKFLRVICGLIPRLVTGARKGKKLGGKFWDNLVYSKIVASHRYFQRVCRYVEINAMEAAGVWSREWERIAKRQQRQGPAPPPG